MEERKNKLGLGVLIGILITLVIGLSAFIIYDKVLSDDNDGDSIQIEDNNKQDDGDNNDSSLNQVIELSVDSNIVKNLHQMSGGEITTESFGLYDSDKLLIKDLEIKNQEDLLYIQLTRESADDIVVQEDSNEYLKWNGSTIKLLWSKVFGSTTEFRLSGRTVNGATYQSDGTLLLPAASGRFEAPTLYIEQVSRATQSDSEIVLYETVKFVDFETEKYYLDAEMTQETTKNAIISANYKKVFKKDLNDNYYFYSIEKIK